MERLGSPSARRPVQLSGRAILRPVIDELDLRCEVERGDTGRVAGVAAKAALPPGIVQADRPGQLGVPHHVGWRVVLARSVATLARHPRFGVRGAAISTLKGRAFLDHARQLRSVAVQATQVLSLGRAQRIRCLGVSAGFPGFVRRSMTRSASLRPDSVGSGGMAAADHHTKAEKACGTSGREAQVEHGVGIVKASPTGNAAARISPTGRPGWPTRRCPDLRPRASPRRRHRGAPTRCPGTPPLACADAGPGS